MQAVTFVAYCGQTAADGDIVKTLQPYLQLWTF